MPKIRKIKLEDRKDSRGGGYSRRKFTVEEADAIRKEYNTSTLKITISSIARKYKVSQPLMYQLLKGTTYTDKAIGGYRRGGGTASRSVRE
jgi:transposase-like protein